MTTVRGPTNSESRTRKAVAASSTRTNREQVNQPGGDRSRILPLPVRQQDDDPAKIPIHALGEMDGSTVAWIVDQTLRNPQAQRQFGKAAWALTKTYGATNAGRST